MIVLTVRTPARPLGQPLSTRHNVAAAAAAAAAGDVESYQWC